MGGQERRPPGLLRVLLDREHVDRADALDRRGELRRLGLEQREGLVGYVGRRRQLAGLDTELLAGLGRQMFQVGVDFRLRHLGLEARFSGRVQHGTRRSGSFLAALGARDCLRGRGGGSLPLDGVLLASAQVCFLPLPSFRSPRASS